MFSAPHVDHDGSATDPTGPDGSVGDPSDDEELCTPVSTDYVGNQYDFGGERTAIDGNVDGIDALAANIAAAGVDTIHQIEAARADLPYGQIAPGSQSPDQLTVYPAPEQLQPSDRFAVTVEQTGGAQDSFVYKISARKPDTNRSADTSWTSFSFAGAVTVRVRNLTGSATDCLVRPLSAGVVTSFADNVCTFTLTEPANVSVEFHPEIHNPIAHPMLVFANPPEVDVPSPSDPNVLYLGPGIHRLGTNVAIESNRTIYIAGGAWVEAAFVANGPVRGST